jgi:hypothetical protein
MAPFPRSCLCVSVPTEVVPRGHVTQGSPQQRYQYDDHPHQPDNKQDKHAA